MIIFTDKVNLCRGEYSKLLLTFRLPRRIKENKDGIMKNIVKLTVSLLAFCIALLLINCSNENTARVEVRLTDSPGDYEELKVDIQGVQVNNSNENSGWISLDIEEGVYDILKLSNGIDTLLGAIELPVGRVEQIRLILGANNSVKIDGQTHDLSTPSAQQSGLKLNVHAELIEGITYEILLDFDAARSVVNRGNGIYSLKPVIRVLNEVTSGAISGMVSPADATPAVYAIAGSDTVGTAFADDTGKFLVRGIPAGSYTVSIVPGETYEPVLKTDVIVTVGSVTDLGVIEF